MVGCWDMIEINHRIFPYTVGLDIDKEENVEDRLLVTFSYPNINALGKDPISEDKVFLVSGRADNIFEATHNLSNRVQEPIDLKHLKVLSISSEVASNEKLVRRILDGLNRDFVINKMVHLLVVKDSTKELLETKLDLVRQETIEGALYSLLRNEQHSTRFTSKTLSDFIEDMDIQGASHMPVGYAPDDEIIISGAGIFKNYKLIGYLNETENRDLALLNQEVIEDGLDINYKGINLSILVTSTKSKKRLVKKQDEFKILFSIEIEGHIHEYILDNDINIDTEERFKSMEKAMAKSVKPSLEKTIKKLQKEFNADVIGVSGYLNRFHPKVWKQLEEEWDSIFPQLDIDVEVDVNIRRRGLTI